MQKVTNGVGLALGTGLLVTMLAGCAPLSTTDPVPNSLPPPISPTPVTGALPNSNGTMDRANQQNTGVYPGAAVENPSTILWKFKVQDLPATAAAAGTVYGRLGSTPAVIGNRVFVGGGVYLFALDAAQGQELWRFPTPGGMVNSPVVAQDTVYFASGDGALYAVAAETGRKLWQFPATSLPVPQRADFTNPVVVGGIVYVGSSQDRIFAFNASTGREVWQRAVIGSITQTPAISAGHLYFGTETHVPPKPSANAFYALDSQTGAIQWQIPLDSAISSSPAVVNGTIYFTGEGLGLQTLDVQTGRLKWKFRHGMSVIATAPTVAYDTVYITFDNSLYALDAQNGAVRWHSQQREVSIISPTIAGQVVYCPTLDGYGGTQVTQPGGVYTFDALTGKQLGRIQVTDELDSGIAIVGGVLYIKSSDGYLYAVR